MGGAGGQNLQRPSCSQFLAHGPVVWHIFGNLRRSGGIRRAGTRRCDQACSCRAWERGAGGAGERSNTTAGRGPPAQRSPNASLDQLDETRETLHELDGDRVRSFGWDARSFIRLITAVTVICLLFDESQWFTVRGLPRDQPPYRTLVLAREKSTDLAFLIVLKSRKR